MAVRVRQEVTREVHDVQTSPSSRRNTSQCQDQPSDDNHGQTPSSDCPTLHLHGAEDMGEAQVQVGHGC